MIPVRENSEVVIKFTQKNVQASVNGRYFQDPIDGGNVNVATSYNIRPYELWGYSLKFSPET